MRSTHCSSERPQDGRGRAWSRALRALGALAALTATAAAHDLWLEPSNHRPRVGDLVDVGLRVGMGFRGDALKRDEQRIVRFAAIDERGGETALLGIDGRAPAGYWRPREAGPFALVYESKPAAIELEAAKFEAYLVEEGLEHVSRLRQERGQTTLAGRELYSRSVKSLVVVEGAHPAASTAFDRRVGLPFEIVPTRDPWAARAGDELSFRVWYDGQPLPGVLVELLSHSDVEHLAHGRTDAQGCVKLKVAAEGAQLVQACWMVPAPEAAGADWRSTWTSLTFSSRAPASR